MIIIKNEDDRQRCTSCWGNHTFELSLEDIVALLNGKTLGDPDLDEYGTFIKMEDQNHD